MAKTIYFVASSMDGYIADARGGLAWLTQFEGADGVREHYESFLAAIGAIMMGAETYAFLLSHGGPWPYPSLPTWVFTRRTFEGPSGADVRFVAGDVASHASNVTQSAGGRNVWLCGGGALAAQVVRAGLLDEIHLGIAPVVLGSGVPVLPTPIGPMTRTQITELGRGFVEIRYSLR